MYQKRKRRYKKTLFREQNGRCVYCDIEMILTFDASKLRTPSPMNMATFEHLDDRFSDERGTHNGERRIVLACNQCNNLRGKERQAEQGLEELRRRSGR